MHVSTPALDAKPEWRDLLKIDRKDGSTLHIINSIAEYEVWQCEEFADLLLRDSSTVKGIREQNKDKKLFVRAVMKTWHDSEGGPAVECTWENLIECMESAVMGGVQDIKDIIHAAVHADQTGGKYVIVHCWILMYEKTRVIRNHVPHTTCVFGLRLPRNTCTKHIGSCMPSPCIPRYMADDNVCQLILCLPLCACKL